MPTEATGVVHHACCWPIPLASDATEKLVAALMAPPTDTMTPLAVLAFNGTAVDIDADVKLDCAVEVFST